jgi:hypothetical protein
LSILLLKSIKTAIFLFPKIVGGVQIRWYVTSIKSIGVVIEWIVSEQEGGGVNGRCTKF